MFFTHATLADEPVQAHLSDLLGIRSTDLPKLVIVKPTTQGHFKKFNYSGDVASLNEASITAFAEEFLAGKL